VARAIETGLRVASVPCRNNLDRFSGRLQLRSNRERSGCHAGPIVHGVDGEIPDPPLFPGEGRHIHHQGGSERLSELLNERVTRIHELNAERRLAKLLMLLFPGPIQEDCHQDPQLLTRSTLGPGSRLEAQVEAERSKNSELDAIIGLGDAMVWESLQELLNGRIIEVQSEEGRISSKETDSILLIPPHLRQLMRTCVALLRETKLSQFRVSAWKSRYRFWINLRCPVSAALIRVG
jgi:hypothetical protein